MTERPFTIAVLVVLALAFTIYLTAQPRTMTAPPGVSTGNYGPAPNLSLPIGPSGAKVDLSSLHGHVVMLDFWATWCGPCKMSIPELERIYENHRNEGLQVVGVSVDDADGRKNVAPVAKELKMTYPITFADDIPDVQSKYAFNSLPTLFVIDKQGTVRYKMVGYDPSAKLDAIITTLLNEN